MRESEGSVSGIAKDGRAEVSIKTDDSAKGCSSHAGHHHCSEGTQAITIKVLNTVGASVGDYVSVRFKPGAIMKSVGVLLGIPLLGVAGGALLGTRLYEREMASSNGAVIAGVACFLLAVLIATFAYKKIFPDIQPYIDHVISTGGIAATLFKTIDPVCKMEVDPLKPGAKIDYRGKAYYFCSAGCLGTFSKDPEKYLGAVGCAQCGSFPA